MEIAADGTWVPATNGSTKPDDDPHSRGGDSEDSAQFVSGAVASCQRSSASARSVASIGSGSWLRGATAAMVALRRRCSLVSMTSPFKKRRSRNGRLLRASAVVCNQWETPGSNRAGL
jgi:hypothetical protein